VDLSVAALLSVFALLAINRAVHLGEGWYTRRRLFWTVQLLNLLGACLLVTIGVPEFQGALRPINLLFAGLLVWHILLNNRRLTAAYREATRAEAPEEDPRRAELLRRMKGERP
jgi:uncharacterized RDD family membrane protein YckC